MRFLIVPFALFALLVPSTVFGGVEFNASGISAKGVPVAFKAKMDITGDTMVLELWNMSPVDTLNPDDTLASFYFDVLKNNARPNLVYSSAVGDVYEGNKNGVDPLIQANANLVAVNPNDDTWQFKTFNDAFFPFLGFGVGTVGNSTLSPNNFNGNITGGINYSIYRNNISTQNLDGDLLVKNHATYTFTGLTGFTNADIVRQSVFGLGTGPDSTLTASIPEPSAVLLLSAIFVGVGVVRRRSR